VVFFEKSQFFDFALMMSPLIILLVCRLFSAFTKRVQENSLFVGMDKRLLNLIVHDT